MLPITEKKILILVLILASLLRFIGTNPGYNRYHPDESILYGSAISMVVDNTLDPGDYYYGSFIPYIHYVADKFVFIPVSWVTYYVSHFSQLVDGLISLPTTIQEVRVVFTTEILGERWINPLFWGRYITALFGVGDVFLIYLIGKKLFSEKVGLLAAFFLACDFKQVMNSHLGLPDIYNVFFFMLAFYSALLVWERPSRKNYIIAGITAGLSFATKYQFLSVIPLIIVHFYVFLNSRKLKNLLNLKPVISTLIFEIVFMLFSPYVLLHLEKALPQVVYAGLRYGVGSNKFNFYPLNYYLNIDYGPIECVLIISGLVFALIKQFKKTVLILSVVTLQLYIYLYYSVGGFYIRNFMLVTPFLFLFASLAFLAVTKKLPLIITLALLALTVFVPAKNSLLNAYYWTKPWGYTVMAAWMNQYYPRQEILAAHPFDVPGGPEVKKVDFDFNHYSLAEHKEEGATWSLLNLDWGADSFYDWMICPYRNLSHCWNKPLVQMENTYYGLAIKEMLKYQVFSATKPWQAPDSNLVIAKIPQWPNVTMKDILDLKSVQTNKLKINVQPGHLYRVQISLYSDNLIGKDGYARLDFDNGETYISARLDQPGKVVAKTIEARAPEGSKEAEITIVADSLDVRIVAKNISVFESVEKVLDITSQAPYHKRPIDINVIFPNSNANL